jgi:hypothetical protein
MVSVAALAAALIAAKTASQPGCPLCIFIIRFDGGLQFETACRSGGAVKYR